MNNHLKAVSRQPMAAQSTIEVKTDAIIEALTEIISVLSGDLVPFISNLVDVVTQLVRAYPWFS